MKKTGWIRILAVLLAMTAFLTLPVSAEETKKIGLVTEDGQQHIYTTAGTLVKNVPAYKCKVNGKTNYYSIDKKGTATRLEGVKAMAAKRLVKLKAGGKKSIKNLKKAFQMVCRPELPQQYERVEGKQGSKVLRKVRVLDRFG